MPVLIIATRPNITYWWMMSVYSEALPYRTRTDDGILNTAYANALSPWQRLTLNNQDTPEKILAYRFQLAVDWFRLSSNLDELYAKMIRRDGVAWHMTSEYHLAIYQRLFFLNDM